MNMIRKPVADIYPCRVMVDTVENNRPVFSVCINNRELFDKICRATKNYIVTGRDLTDKRSHAIIKILSDVDAHLIFAESNTPIIGAELLAWAKYKAELLGFKSEDEYILELIKAAKEKEKKK